MDAGRRASRPPARPLPGHPPHRQRRHGRRVAGRGCQARPAGRGQGPGARVRRRRGGRAALRARGARRRAPVRPPARRHHLRLRPPRGHAVHRDGAASPAARSRSACAPARRSRGTPRCGGCARRRERSTPPTRPASCTATSSPETSSSTRRTAWPSPTSGSPRVAADSSLTQTGMIVGTAAYLSPEQRAGPGRDAAPAIATRWRWSPASCCRTRRPRHWRAGWRMTRRAGPRPRASS